MIRQGDTVRVRTREDKGNDLFVGQFISGSDDFIVIKTMDGSERHIPTANVTYVDNVPEKA